MVEQAKRSNINIRPQGQPDAKGYSPHRDLAYVYPQMMREAFIMLDEVNWTMEFTEKMRRHAITEEMLAEAVGKFVAALNMFIREPDIASPRDAFHATGFHTVNEVVRDALWTRFGEVLTGGWFVAVRDVTLRGSMSDAADVMIDMLTAGRMVAAALAGGTQGEDEFNLSANDAAVAMERLKVENGELQRTLLQTQKDKRQLEETCRSTEAKFKEVDTIAWELLQTQAYTNDMTTAIKEFLSASFVSRLLKGVVIFTKAVLKREVFNVTLATLPASQPGDNIAEVPHSA
jgi:hypothetical protein